MDRASAISYLDSILNEVFVALGYDLSQLESRLAHVLDDTLLAMGIPYAEGQTYVAPDTSVVGYRAVLRMMALRAALTAAIPWVNVTVSDPSVSKQKSQFYDHLQIEYARAKEEAASYVTTTSGETFTTGAIIFGDDLLGEFASLQLL